MAQKHEKLGIILGALSIIPMHIIGMIILLFLVPYLPYFKTGYNIFLLPGLVGIWQLFYVIPVIIWLKTIQRIALMKGVIIGAVITVLLTGGCWILISIRF